MRNRAQRQYDTDKQAMPVVKMRLLLVQFNSELLTQNENSDAKEYYNKLYSTVPGYNRFGPTWEIPVWIAEMKRNFPDAEILFADSLASIVLKAYSGQFTHLAFSALDCNWKYIRTIADQFNGTVIVGGYCDIDNLQDLQNISWCHSIRECCEIFDVEYKTGVDYTDFAGAKTIARLTLSTGCQHRCKFCTVPNEVVKTLANDVYQQADEICRLNSPLVYVNDKTFGQCENFWMLPDLFQVIRQQMAPTMDKNGHNFDPFSGFIIQTTPSQLLKLDDDFLLSAGVRYVELGIETYNSKILESMNKPASIVTIDKATEKLRRLGIKLIPNIMIGLPGETQTTYSRTLHWLASNADIISHLNIYNLAVYADSDLFDEVGPGFNHTDENQIPDSINAELFATLLYSFGMQRLGGSACKDEAKVIDAALDDSVRADKCIKSLCIWRQVP